MNMCRHKHGFHEIHEGKLFLESALIILACGLWSPVCHTVAPTSSADHSPLRWRSPAVSTTSLCPPLPLGPFTKPPSCSLSQGSSNSCGAAAGPSLSLIPYSGAISITPDGFRWTSRFAFVNFGYQTKKQEAAMCADAHAL